MQPQTSNDVIIIGAGLGGLFTGAILAKEGYHVTLLEQNTNIGGGLQNFIRRGVHFDTGMHMLGGMRKGGVVYRICQYLGIADQLSLRDVDDDCMDSLYFACDHTEYRIASGREGFIQSLAQHFPTERDNLRRYVDAMYAISREVRLFNLQPTLDTLESHSPQFLQSANQFIATYITDERLRAVLAYMNPMYGGVADHTPAYIHCLINVLYIDGTNRFVGGSAQLAEALRHAIESRGGQVLAGHRVTHIEVVDRNIQYVITDDGSSHTAQHYISAIHPCTLLPLLSEGAVPRAYINRLGDIPNTYSAFCVFLSVDDAVMPYINHTCYWQNHYDTIWRFDTHDDATWPHGIMYMTPPVPDQGPYATHLIATAPMTYEAVRQWHDTTIAHRGADYEEWKRQHAQRIIDILLTRHPQLRGHIRHIYTSSPLTIRDYYGVKEGSMYGFRKDCQNMALSAVPIYTKVRNLLLTGQCINLHGICGVPLTAINTAEALLGLNTVSTTSIRFEGLSINPITPPKIKW